MSITDTASKRAYPIYGHQLTKIILQFMKKGLVICTVDNFQQSRPVCVSVLLSVTDSFDLSFRHYNSHIDLEIIMMMKCWAYFRK